MSALRVWQACLQLSDREGAEMLGLEPKEFARQKATRLSRQSALLAVLTALYRPDMAAIAATATALAGAPAPRSAVDPPCGSSASDWS
jgi:hypothetical protein